ncbi:MAG: hypothetical protein WBP13_09215 [Methylophilaceae bacterium]
MIKLIFKLNVLALTFVLSSPIQAAPNDNFGRLFSRPAERSNLDYMRQNQKLKVIIPQAEVAPESLEKLAPPELPDPITMQGYVKRNDGKANTLWINNQAVQENSTVDDVKIGKLNQRGFSSKGKTLEGVDVKIPANGKQIRLKAGQTYEPENNKIYERQLIEKAKNIELEQSGAIDGGDE